MPGQGPTSYLDAAQREKALQQMQQMSSAQIVSATAHMQPRMGTMPPVTYPGGFWQHPGLGQTSPHDVKPFAQSPFLQGDKTPTSLGMGMGALASSPQLGTATPTPAPAWQVHISTNIYTHIYVYICIYIYLSTPRCRAAVSATAS